MSATIIRGATDVSTRLKVDLRTVRGLRSRLGGPSSRSSIRLGRSLWQGRDASTEAEIVFLFRFPVTISRRNKQSLNSLIGSASILLMPEQSLNRGGNNLDLPVTASFRRKKKFCSD